MRTDWLPTSAAALAVGGIALFLGSRTAPRRRSSDAVLEAIEREADPWTSPSIILLVAAVALLIGLPSMLVLLGRKGRWAGWLAVCLMAVAAITFAGLAQQLLFLHSLVEEAALRPEDAANALMRSGQWRLIMIGFSAFYVGEFLLAYALWRGGRTPRFVPLLFMGHVVMVAFGLVLEGADPGGFSVLLIAAGFSSCAICANLAGLPSRRSSADASWLYAQPSR